MQEINIPFGLCQFTYRDVKYVQGSDATFEALPKFKEIRGGALNHIQKYLTEEYNVSFEVSLDQEDYDVFKLHFPILKDHNHGLIDDIGKNDMSTNRLIIKPLGIDTDDHNITIFNAYIEPMSFTRTYNKRTDKFKIKFVGKPTYINNKFKNSYFYIGNFDELEGVDL